MVMETPLGRVRGLGSARSGAHHWWLERLTSVSTLLLAAWLLASLLMLPDLAHETVTRWLRGPVNATLMLLFIISTFWHLKLGMQVVWEDYIHDEVKVVAITLTNFLTIAGGALAIFSVLRIAFGGGAS